MATKNKVLTKHLFTFFLFLISLFYVGCNRSKDLKEWSPKDHGTVISNPQSAPETAPKEKRSNPAPSKSGQSANFLWQTTCASCHGALGKGNGPKRPKGFPIPDFTNTEWQASKTEDQIKHAITFGKGMMPGFGNRIPASSIEKLATHVRTFSQK